MTRYIELDGSEGEGGGQILRTALALSMCTGQPTRIINIRGKRKTPGLMRQHLTAVQAATEICGARVEGDRVGSPELSFEPGTIRGGNYRFAIGTAGSCTLVLQTVLPALLQADAPSRITLNGGTHNPLAPPFHFLDRAFVPVLRKMGAEVTLELSRYGFYPAGGGEFSATITPVAKLAPITLNEPGARLNVCAEAYIAALPTNIAQRELDIVRKRMGWNEEQLSLRALSNDRGPGNALLITVQQAHVTEVFSGFGEKGVTAEAVAERTVEQARHYLTSGAAVGPFLADQLLLPMALAGSGTFTVSSLSRHAVTNADVIRRFLGIRISMTQLDNEAFLITIGNTDSDPQAGSS